MKKILSILFIIVSMNICAQTYSAIGIIEHNKSTFFDTINVVLVLDTIDNNIVIETLESEPEYYSWFEQKYSNTRMRKYVLLDINDVEGIIIFKKDEIIIVIDDIKYRYILNK